MSFRNNQSTLQLINTISSKTLNSLNIPPIPLSLSRLPSILSFIPFPSKFSLYEHSTPYTTIQPHLQHTPNSIPKISLKSSIYSIFDIRFGFLAMNYPYICHFNTFLKFSKNHLCLENTPFDRKYVGSDLNHTDEQFRSHP